MFDNLKMVDNNFSELQEFLKVDNNFSELQESAKLLSNSEKLLSNIRNFGKFTVEHHFSAPKIMEFRIFST